MGTDGLVVLIVLPIRDDMLGLMRLLVLVVGLFVTVVRERLLEGVLVLIELPIREVMPELILPFELFRLLELSTGRLTVLRLDRFDVDELGRVVICRPRVLELGAVDRELIDRLDVLLLDWLLLILSEVEGLLELLLLELRLDVTRLELRLDETLLERLNDDDLDVALGAGAGLEACRLCLLELRDLLLLDRVLAAKTGSATSARISTKRT